MSYTEIGLPSKVSTYFSIRQYGKRFPQLTNEYHKLAKDVSFMVGAMAAYVYNVPEVGDSKRIDCNELSMFKAMADNIKEKNKEALDNLNKLAQELILPS